MAMNLLKIKPQRNTEGSTPKNFISFNLIFVKGTLTDPKTQRLLLILAFLLFSKISPENIPYLKNLFELFQNIK